MWNGQFSPSVLESRVLIMVLSDCEPKKKFYMVKPNMPMRYLFCLHVSQLGEVHQKLFSTRFSMKDNILCANDTWESLNMEPGDFINVNHSYFSNSPLKLYDNIEKYGESLASLVLNNRILIKIKYGLSVFNNNRIYIYNVTSTTKMKELMQLHSYTIPERMNKYTFQFQYMNRIVHKEDTPESLGIKFNAVFKFLYVRKVKMENVEANISSMSTTMSYGELRRTLHDEGVYQLYTNE